MDPGRNAEPGAGPAEDWDSLSDKATIALLKRRLMEAEHNVQLWKEQADEARTELIKCKSNAKVLQTELENTQKELAQVRGEAPKQGGLASREPWAEVEQKLQGPESPTQLPPSKSTQINQEEELAAAATPEGVKVNEVDDRLARDHALAKLLDQELNTGNSDTSHQVSPVRSLWNGSLESQLEKAKAKNHTLKKKLEEMEATAYHYQKLHRQERCQHIRLYNQARDLETEYDSARKHIHEQDENLKTVRDELKEMKEMKEELGSFLDRWNTRVGLLPVPESISPSADE